MSSILFRIVTELLLEKDFGCHVGHYFYGTIGYAVFLTFSDYNCEAYVPEHIYVDVFIIFNGTKVNF